MAICNDITLYNGLVVSYHKIEEMKEDMATGERSVVVASFINKNESDVGKPPHQKLTFSYEYTGSGDPRDSAYAKLMKSPVFAGGIEC